MRVVSSVGIELCQVMWKFLLLECVCVSNRRIVLRASRGMNDDDVVVVVITLYLDLSFVRNRELAVSK